MNIFTTFLTIFFISSLFRQKVRNKKRPLFMSSIKMEGFEHILILPIMKIDGSPWIWNSRTKKWLHAYKNHDGYWMINLPRKKGKGRTSLVHRILAITFIPNPNNYKLVDHINRNKSDNDLKNLRWATHKMNSNNSPENRKEYHMTFGNRETFDGKQIPVSYITKDASNTIETNYFLQKDGKMLNKKTKRFLGGRKLSNGYIQLCLRVGNKNYYRYLHVMLALMFIPNPSPLIYTIVDHIDRNPENNSLDNLRWVTPPENDKNRNKSDNKSSKYHGVYLETSLNKWRAYTTKDKISYRLGYFSSEITAAKAHDKKEYELFGNYANLNFPKEIEQTMKTDFISEISHSKSKHKGLTWDDKCGKWRVRITIQNGKRLSLGYFSNEEEAAETYEKKLSEFRNVKRRNRN